MNSDLPEDAELAELPLAKRIGAYAVFGAVFVWLHRAYIYGAGIVVFLGYAMYQYPSHGIRFLKIVTGLILILLFILAILTIVGFLVYRLGEHLLDTDTF